MNIPLKTLLIFGLLIALVSTQEFAEAEDSVDGGLITAPPPDNIDPPISATTSAAPETSTTVTTAAATTTVTQAPETSTTVTTAAATTTVTQDTKETTTGTFNTGTTSNSTDGTPTSTIAATTTTTTQGPCASSPCVGDSTCEERFGGSFACICRAGLVYLARGCTLTKVFPGRLTLNLTFTTEMADRKSKQFQETASQIENALRKVLMSSNNGYVNSTVLSLSSGSIVAEVQNFYDFSSSVTSETIERQILDGIRNEISEFEEFSRVSACDISICDNTTTDECKEEEVGGTVICTCREGYIRSPFTSHSCLSCPNGEKAENEERCVKCSFGFAGFNCNDPYLLVVVVVSTVSGVLLIIFIVALIVVSCRNPKESSSSQVDFSSSYGNMELHKPTGVPRIPRANPDASWKSNNLEMANSGSNQALVTRDRPESKMRYSDHEEDVSYRGQVPPAYSGYSGRGVENGGVQNPYFRQDDDRLRRY